MKIDWNRTYEFGFQFLIGRLDTGREVIVEQNRVSFNSS